MIQFVFVWLLFQVPTPTPLLDSMNNSISGYTATAEALQQQQSITTENGQFYDENGAPLLPNAASPEMLTTMGYMKWMLYGDISGVFGPFSPIIQHMKIFFVFTIVRFSNYFVLRLINLVTRFVVWLIENWEVALVILIVGLIVAFIAFIEQKLNYISAAIEWLTNLDWSFWN